MTDNNHPITPPEELLQEWCQQGRNCMSELNALKELATQAARWGADMELEACCEWLTTKRWIPAGVSSDLRAARRPEPPSLKEQALAVVENSAVCDHLSIEHADILRRALEALDD